MSTAARQRLNAGTEGLSAKKHQRFLKQIAAGFVLASAILAGVGLVSYRTMTRLIKISNQVTHSQEVINNLENVLTLMTDAETGQRGYLLTGKNHYLVPYSLAVEAVNPEVTALEKLTADNPNDQNRLRTVKHLITNKLAELKQTINLRKDKGFEAALQIVQTDQGDNLMDNIRRLIHEMELEEKQLLAQRSQATAAIAHKSFLTFSGGFLLNLFVIAGVYYVIYREITERHQVEEQVNLLQTLMVAIAESQDFDAALEVILSTVCETKGWNYGEAWIPCPDDTVLTCSSAWYSSTDSRDAVNLPVLEKFRRLSQEFTFPSGTGLPGRVWSSQQPEWLQDISREPKIIFQRADIARDCGLRTGLGIPLIVKDQVLAVIVFFKFKSYKQDTRLVESISAIAAELGSLIQRFSVESELRQTQEKLELRVRERTKALAQTNEALRHGKERYRSLVVATSQVVWTTDAEGQVEDMPSWRAYTGQSKSEVRGWRWLDALHPEDRDRIAQVWSDAIRTKSVYNVEYRVRGADGNYRYFSVRGVPVMAEETKVSDWIGTCTDISERKEAEAVMRRAQDEAEAANRAKSEFLAMMSHEIRTPMNAVIGMTELVLNTLLTPQQREFIETIRSSGEALLNIINDILDFSKIESGKLELEEHPFDLRMFVETALDLLSPAAGAKNLELAYLIDPQTPSTILGDDTRLRQVLVNLLSNAVKFTATGEVVVSVTAHLVEGSEYEIQFAVKDTGIGIPQERMDRLFKPFSQVDASMTRRYGGTGLGLAISKRLSEMMGGRIWVESQVGVGSTFYFTLLAKLAPSSVVVEDLVVPPGLAGKRLLVVDDNATNRQILTLQAQSWGMQIRIAESSEQVLEWLTQGEQFDVAVLDMQMPGIDGLSLAAHIHSLPSYQDLPLVILSCVGKPILEDLGQKADFVAFLSKPIKQSQLYDAFVRIFSQQWVCVRPNTSLPPQFDSQLAQQLPLRMLLVEDMPLNQKVALLMLQQLGYSADVASNGTEALVALSRQDYDVVFMDVQMPEMDGLEATRWILKQWSPASRPWIIAMTAHTMQGDREECLNAGMNDYISKPIRVKTLVQALNNYRHSGDQLREQSAPLPLCPSAPLPLCPSIDAEVLQALRDMAGDDAPSVLAEVISSYLEDASPRLKAITLAVVDGDAAAVQKSAHALRSLSVTVGGIPLAQVCEALETMGRAGTTVGAEVLVKQLQIEFERLEAALQLEHSEGKYD